MKTKEKKVQTKRYLKLSKWDIFWSTFIFVIGIIICFYIDNYFLLLGMTIGLIIKSLTNLNVKYVPTLYKINGLNSVDEFSIFGMIGIIENTMLVLKEEEYPDDVIQLTIVNPKTLKVTSEKIRVYRWQLQKVEKVK